MLCGYFEHQRRVPFEGSAAEPLQTITAILVGSKWSCLLLQIVLHCAQSEVLKCLKRILTLEEENVLDRKAQDKNIEREKEGRHEEGRQKAEERVRG